MTYILLALYTLYIIIIFLVSFSESDNKKYLELSILVIGLVLIALLLFI